MASPAEPLVTPAGSSHLGKPAFLARYGTLVDVRHAIDLLEARGVDGDDITLVGRSGELPHMTDRRRADSRILSHTMLALAMGVVAGALAGAAIGAVVVGLAVLLWPGLDATGWVFALITVWFAAGGSVLGCFAAISKVVGFSESWPLTFEDATNGPVWLAVYDEVDDPDDLASTTHALELVHEPDVRVSNEPSNQ
jgi:hypothetical protein